MDHTVAGGKRGRSGRQAWRGALTKILLLLVLTSRPALAGLDVMTNHELGELEGGRLIELAVSNGDYYGANDATVPGVDTEVTVVRFASDIYLENYGEIGALKLGDYPRSVSELGDMASMDSNYTMVYGPQNRTSPSGNNAHITGTYSGTANPGAGSLDADEPYDNNPNREDRIHDRYGSGTQAETTIGFASYLHSAAPHANFGADPAHPETYWDINWEKMRVGVSEEYPLRIYGLVLRAEFDNWGTSNQQLRRLIIGSNNLYGYSSARPLVTSGWLNAEMSRLNNAALPVTKQVCFQLQRDPLMDQYWQLSSFNFNPDDPSASGSFRQFWFNTNMYDVTVNPSNDTNLVGRYQNKDHGFFLMIDLTDKRFGGWNIIGGVNEYRDWPPLEQDDDRYFENEYRSNEP